MTTAQVVETSVTVNNHSPIQDYVNQDDQTLPFEMTPGFKPFTKLIELKSDTEVIQQIWMMNLISALKRIQL